MNRKIKMSKEKRFYANGKNVEKKIWDVEGFQVNFLSSVGKNLRDNKKDMPQYPFTRKAPGDMTVSEWKQNRFNPNYPGLDVEVLDVVNMPVAGQTKLKNVRATYVDE